MLVMLATMGCSTTAITLRHPDTNQVTQCGPYLIMNPFFPAISGTHDQERDCIQDFQRQGFERDVR
jgi:hypothetical protein